MTLKKNFISNLNRALVSKAHQTFWPIREIVIVGQRHKVGFVIADSMGPSSAQQAEEPRDEPKALARLYFPARSPPPPLAGS